MPKKSKKEVKYPRLAAYMTEQFKAWQAEQKEIVGVKEFADYLGIHENYVGKYLRGENRPTDGLVVQIGNKLGNGIYETLEWPIPQYGGR